MNPHKNHALDTLIITLLLGADFITMLLGGYFPGKSGFFAIVIGVVISLSLARIMSHPITKISSSLLVLLVLIFLFFLLTQFFCGNRTNLLITDFIGMCFLPMLLAGSLYLDYKGILRSTMYLVIFAIPVFQQVFAKANYGNNYDAVSMGSSYAMLPIIGASIVHYMFYRKEATLVDNVVYLINAFFLLSFIQMSYRGALLSVVILFVVCLVIKKMDGGITKKNIIFLLVASIVAIVVVVNLDSIIKNSYDLLKNMGVHIAILDKSVFLMTESSKGLFNGRIDVWKRALQGFLESPLFGHGMTTFKYYTGYIFPHNFVLQFLFDGGVILTVPLLCVIFNGTKIIVRNKDTKRDRLIFFIFVAGCAFPRALVSAETWRITLLWITTGFLCNKWDPEDTDIVLDSTNKNERL